MLLAGSADRVTVQLGIPYEGQIWFYRVAVLALPPLAFVLVKRVCEELRAEAPRAARALTPGRAPAGPPP